MLGGPRGRAALWPEARLPGLLLSKMSFILKSTKDPIRTEVDRERTLPNWWRLGSLCLEGRWQAVPG